QALVVPESLLKRYSVRPWESTRICPRPVVVTSTVAAGSPAAAGGAAGFVAALPQPATASATATALASPVRDLLGVMVGPCVGGEPGWRRAGGRARLGEPGPPSSFG